MAKKKKAAADRNEWAGGDMSETARMSWEEWDAYRLSQLGVRDFATDPLAPAPRSRTNRVKAGGNLKVSSDVAAWLKTLPLTEPRGFGLTFHDLTPPKGAGKDVVEKAGEMVARQTSAATALSALGCYEGGEFVMPEQKKGSRARGGGGRAAAPVRPAKAGAPAKRARAAKPAKAAKAPRRARAGGGDVPASVLRARQSNAVRRAYRDYVQGRALYQKGHYHVRNMRSGALSVAPWDELVRARFKRPQEFYKAALDWGRSWQGRTAGAAAGD